MHPAIRSQADNLGDVYDEESKIFFDPSTDRARQEFAADADINEMFRKFGVFGDPRKPLTFGEVDYTIDLQQALGAIEEAKRVYARMPANVKEKYGSWQAMINAAAAGELELELKPKPAPDVTPEPTVPA